MTGVHIAWHYAQQNKKTRERKRQLFYCAPSNEAVDVVAREYTELACRPVDFVVASRP